MLFLWVPVINLNLDGTGPRIVDIDMAGAGGASSSADATRIAAASMAGAGGASSSLDADDIPAPRPEPPPIQGNGGGSGGYGGGYGGHVPHWFESPKEVVVAAASRLVDVSISGRARSGSSMDADAIEAIPGPRIVDVDAAARAESRALASVGRIVSAAMLGVARSRGFARAGVALAGPARPERPARPVGPILRWRRATVRS